MDGRADGAGIGDGPAASRDGARCAATDEHGTASARRHARESGGHVAGAAAGDVDSQPQPQPRPHTGTGSLPLRLRATAPGEREKPWATDGDGPTGRGGGVGVHACVRVA
jgi:hypothetical protein